MNQAQRKERELNDDPEDLQLFFDRIATWIKPGGGDYEPVLPNYSSKEESIAINMVEVQDAYAKRHLQWRIDWKMLKNSPHLLRANYPASKPGGGTIKCWWFRREALE